MTREEAIEYNGLKPCPFCGNKMPWWYPWPRMARMMPSPAIRSRLAAGIGRHHIRND